MEFKHENTTSKMMNDQFEEFPVEYRSNLPFIGSQADIHKHVQDVLSPLMPYIRNKRASVNGQFYSQADALNTALGGTSSSTILNDGSTPVILGGGSTSSVPDLNLNSVNAGSNHGVLTTNTFTANGEIIQLFEYKYDIVAAAQIGPYTFT